MRGNDGVRWGGGAEAWVVFLKMLTGGINEAELMVGGVGEV